MSIPEQEIATILKNDQQISTINSLEQISEAQGQLSKVKESLGAIINTMTENQSIFSQAANYWGELPLWLKITGGLVLTAPTLAVGIFANVGALLAISGVTVVAYTASGIILDDHNNCSVHIVDNLKKGIFSLADVLEITIAALETIRIKFMQEIEKFKTENLKLTRNVETLGDQVETLGDQVETFIETTKSLRETKKQLEESTLELKKTVQEHSESLQESQIQLVFAKNEYEKSQIELSEKIVELRTTKELMEQDIEKARTNGMVLAKTVSTLSKAVLADEEQKVVFQGRLNNFLSDSSASFDQINERICKAERDLKLVTNELQQSNEQYRIHLERQEKQIIRLERLDTQLRIEQAIPKEAQIDSNKPRGFFPPQKHATFIPPVANEPIMVI